MLEYACEYAGVHATYARMCACVRACVHACVRSCVLACVIISVLECWSAVVVMECSRSSNSGSECLLREDVCACAVACKCMRNCAYVNADVDILEVLLVLQV